MTNNFHQLLNSIKNVSICNYNKDFLLSWQKTDSEIQQIVLVAEALKYLRENNIATNCFQSGLAISLFRDQSTRTRFSFASAANLLGLGIQDFDEKKSQVSHGETIRETANMISFFTEIIGIRDDMYLGEGNSYMKEVSTALKEGYDEGVLQQNPSIINLQCDIDHPTQTMADLIHLKNHFGSIEKLKGKKIAMSWAYSPSYGKPLSVPQGIIGLLTRFGMNVDLAFPEGYDLLPEVIKIAKINAKKSGGEFNISNSMDEAFADADIVYPKSWAPLHIMKERTELLKTKNTDALQKLEIQCLENNFKHKSWECNETKMNLTNKQNALYMHCLPADISNVSCKNGEVSEKVFEKYRIQTYKQAANKPYVIAAMMLCSRFKEAATTLGNLYDEGLKRKFV
ncbi:MAG: knotted carbamoyltransferase YgeW [Bacteroidetes bacterium]|jgi:knotted carbamoyltransferase YgeW|nr:knotted carbamoyltransferase YgeW [Bacteroidota bacterium]MBT6685099.1 knotted carbamoyltransferase YgeW [Bacteroidota bacterium]MBT7141936.1 knotted carbamoyltransferase YgeW [Bacteroidota bacterium]MBT7491179.1 knotted carbamoyltransferase YgeW [Bacteroidota bacterium]